MLTTKQHESGLDDVTGLASIPDAHMRSAIEQSAMHAARLAIARWSGGSAFPQRQVDAALRPSAQAAWYAQAQENFQQWLACGGWSRADAPAEMPAAELLAPK